MKISEVIRNLERYKENFGDQDLYIDFGTKEYLVKDVYREKDKVKIYN